MSIAGSGTWGIVPKWSGSGVEASGAQDAVVWRNVGVRRLSCKGVDRGRNSRIACRLAVGKENHIGLAAFHLKGCCSPGRRMVAPIEIGVAPAGARDIASRAGLRTGQNIGFDPPQ